MGIDMRKFVGTYSLSEMPTLLETMQFAIYEEETKLAIEKIWVKVEKHSKEYAKLSDREKKACKSGFIACYKLLKPFKYKRKPSTRSKKQKQ